MALACSARSRTVKESPQSPQSNRESLRERHSCFSWNFKYLLAIAAATSCSAFNQLTGSLLSAITNIPPVFAFEPSIPSRPSWITVDTVSQKYPVTLMDKLFSSVPKRENAIHNINLSFGHMGSSPSPLPTPPNDGNDGVILLVGRSASGKSTLLRLIAGMEHPTGGCVSINGREYDSTAQAGTMPGTPSWVKMGTPLSLNSFEETCYGLQPVILQGKPDFDDTLSVMERVVQVGLGTVHQCNKTINCLGKESRDAKGVFALVQALSEDMTSLLTLSEEQCSGVPSKLSPSGEYLFGIACSCMMSVAPLIATQNNIQKNCKSGIHYPTILFDELFDTEHPNTVENCSKGLGNLIRRGGVVISATHRPEYFKGMATRTVTLSGGKVLMDKFVV